MKGSLFAQLQLRGVGQQRQLMVREHRDSRGLASGSLMCDDCLRYYRN